MQDKQAQIDCFIAELAQQPHGNNFYNPYQNQKQCDNLRHYLNLLADNVANPVLLVGEAPGYKGCKITGIPFTSGAIFNRFRHPILQALASDISLNHIESENTATIVWDYLSSGRKNTVTRWRRTPLFWNSFPFHPHPEGNHNKNRAPNNDEIALGMHYLKRLVSIFEPSVIAGIGGKGVQCVKQCFPEFEVVYIRHPSFGGKSDFIKGMNNIYRSVKI